MVTLWHLEGSQNMFPTAIWKAELYLYDGGTCLWKETFGGNKGAMKKGIWRIKRNKFHFQYRTPNVGEAKWRGTLDASGNGVTGDYAVGPKNAYGGKWRGVKSKIYN